MYPRILIVTILALLAFVVPSNGQSLCVETPGICFTFDQTHTSFTYNFGVDGRITVQFDTVLQPFALIVTPDHTIDAIDNTEFPINTVCVKYSTNSNQCVEYDFSGFSNGPNGVPVKDVDYKGLISLVLVYATDQTINTPAFGHAPGDNSSAEYSENILTFYSDPTAPSCPTCDDPGMGGKTPGLSAVAALDIPILNPENVCNLTVTPVKSSSGQNPLVEVSFQLFAAGCAGTPLKDKTATLSVASVDSLGNFLSFASLVNGGDSNKFHWDGQGHSNIQDVNTKGLPDGRYAVTIISNNFSPVNAFFCVTGGNPISCN